MTLSLGVGAGLGTGMRGRKTLAWRWAWECGQGLLQECGVVRTAHGTELERCDTKVDPCTTLKIPNPTPCEGLATPHSSKAGPSAGSAQLLLTFALKNFGFQ